MAGMPICPSSMKRQIRPAATSARMYGRKKIIRNHTAPVMRPAIKQRDAERERQLHEKRGDDDEAVVDQRPSEGRIAGQLDVVLEADKLFQDGQIRSS